MTLNNCRFNYFHDKIWQMFKSMWIKILYYRACSPKKSETFSINKEKIKLPYSIMLFIHTFLRGSSCPYRKSCVVLKIYHYVTNPVISLVTSRESSNFIGHFLFLWRSNKFLRLGRILDIGSTFEVDHRKPKVVGVSIFLYRLWCLGGSFFSVLTGVNF